MHASLGMVVFANVMMDRTCKQKKIRGTREEVGDKVVCMSLSANPVLSQVHAGTCYNTQIVQY